MELARGGLRLSVDDTGGAGPPVVLLHGFPEDRHCWAGVTARLAAAGHRVLAPDQRGVAPASRPADLSGYRLEALAGDVAALVETAGTGPAHVVGHDLGALVAWTAAALHPEQVASVTGLSVPHPAAMTAAARRPAQARRSWYVALMVAPGVDRLVGAADGRPLAALLRRSGLGDPDAARWAAALADAEAARARLAWYRALVRWGAPPLPAIEVPSLLVWGRSDPFVGPTAVARHRRSVPGGRVLELDAGHWLPECHAGPVADAVAGMAAG